MNISLWRKIKEFNKQVFNPKFRLAEFNVHQNGLNCQFRVLNKKTKKMTGYWFSM